ncbi:MAG TPA: HlyD family efflux transporter periplasmic adaptor subunit [Bryobacteraceae bacterium]
MSDSQAPAKRPPVIVRILILLLLAGGGYLLWRHFSTRNQGPDNVITLSGRIEGDDSAVSPKTTGRVIEIRYREGDIVKAGDIIATLDDEQVRAREEQAQAALAQAVARLNASRQQTAILGDQLQQTEIQTNQSKVDADGRVRQAEADLAAAEAELAQQQSSLQLANFDKDAYTRLAKTGAVSDRQAKQAVTTADAQTAAVASAERRVEAARGALAMARSTLENPSIRVAQSAGIRKQMAQQTAEIASAAADEARARAQVIEAQANRRDLTVVAPFDGTVISRTAEPGEVITAGTPIVTLLDLHKVYLRGYVPEGQIGRVKTEQQARIYLDSSPNQPIEAYVSRIDPQATFTPENTYFRDDRVKQVVGLKLQLKSGFGLAKPGMPADGEILVAGDSWPATTRNNK